MMTEENAALVADGLLSVSEASDFTGLSRSDLYVRMDKGLPYVKLGKRRLIPRKALVELAALNLVVRQAN